MVRLRTLSRLPILFLIGASWLPLLPAPLLTEPVVAGGPGAPTDYQPPVDAPVVDPFRPPAHIGGAGNRGLEYATAPGSPVHAAKRGQVTFAGSVAGSLHVTVAHTDGLRTSYSYLLELAVEKGEFVSQGQILGTSGATLHFGARDGSTYIDPEGLFDPRPGRVRLVPLISGPEQVRQLRPQNPGPLGWLRAAEAVPREANPWLGPMRLLADLAVHFGSSLG